MLGGGEPGPTLAVLTLATLAKASLARLLRTSGLDRAAPRTHLVHCAAELHAALAGAEEDGSVGEAASGEAAAAAAEGKELWFLKDAVHLLASLQPRR